MCVCAEGRIKQRGYGWEELYLYPVTVLGLDSQNMFCNNIRRMCGFALHAFEFSVPMPPAWCSADGYTVRTIAQCCCAVLCFVGNSSVVECLQLLQIAYAYVYACILARMHA